MRRYITRIYNEPEYPAITAVHNEMFDGDWRYPSYNHLVIDYKHNIYKFKEFNMLNINNIKKD